MVNYCLLFTSFDEKFLIIILFFLIDFYLFFSFSVFPLACYSLPKTSLLDCCGIFQAIAVGVFSDSGEIIAGHNGWCESNVDGCVQLPE